MAPRMRAMDGLRGLLALYILAGHSLPLLWPVPGAGWLTGLFSHGRAAVDLFFCLSGLVILHALGAGGLEGALQAKRFLALRAGRLLPVYLLALLLAALSLWAGNPYPLMPWLATAGAGVEGAVRDILAPGWPAAPAAHLAAHLALVQGLLPPAVLPDAEYALLGPAWSLSTEWQFYALLALALAAAPWLLRPAARGPLGGIAPAAAGLILLGLLGSALPLAPAAWQFGRAFLPREAWYFALGMASAPLLARPHDPAARRGYGLVLLAALGLSLGAGGGPALLVPLAWTLCLIAEAGLGRGGRLLGALLAQPALSTAAAISYPLYLLHVPVQRLLMLALGPLAQGDWRLFSLLWGPAAVLLPLALAALVHHAVEEPCRRWSRALILGPDGRRLPARGLQPLRRRLQ
ncbi:acyltransferase family protein [Acidisoma sp. C75]